MAFTITELHELEISLTHAQVKHCDESIVAIIPEPLTRLASLNEQFVAELDYSRVVKHEAGLAKDDSISGIFATDDSAVVIVDGSISSLLEISREHVLIDIYIQNGPEFISINSEDLGGVVPEVGSRIRLWLQGLKIYPTFT